MMNMKSGYKAGGMAEDTTRGLPGVLDQDKLKRKNTPRPMSSNAKESKAAAKQRREAAREKARKARKELAKKTREEGEARIRARREQAGYNSASKQMPRQMRRSELPGFAGRANRFLDKATDDIGDAMRSGASAIGLDSDFDTGRMKARKEIKGYKKGGMAKKGGMKSGGKVRGCGIARQGVRKAKMR
jgi:hypothetical protein|tara:strand:- start:2091 stop:2654 length:564 start_codon:yes stop_codon:yes gene_type:complete